jgi:transmembrane sensor
MSKHCVGPIQTDTESKKAGMESAKLDLEALKWTRSLPHANEAERAAFAHWVLHSRQNLEAFLRHEALGTVLRGMDPQHQIDIDTLVALARTASRTVLPPATFYAGARSTMTRATDIEQRASEWIIRSEAGNFTEDMRAELERWLQDPRNRVIYIRIREGWRRAGRLHSARSHDGNVDPDLFDDRDLTIRPPQPNSKHRWPFGVTAGAGAVLTLILHFTGVLLWSMFGSNQWTSYTTGIGGYEIVSLPDGSSVQLNANTKIRERVTADKREIQLVRGEALFKVADSVRPFTVRLVGTSIRIDSPGMTETTFAVRLGAPEKVAVAVVEGCVLIGPTERVAVGELANVDAAGIHVANVGVEEINRKLAWTAGPLSFQGEIVQELAGEIDYGLNHKPHNPNTPNIGPKR